MLSVDKSLFLAKVAAAKEQVLARIQQGAIVYPPQEKWFRAFQLTPIEKVRVVIIGQDPYHGRNQANGLAFSVEKNVPFPPSLRNIFLELQQDAKVPIPPHGDLTAWALQGVLLVNTVLTVEQGQPFSHGAFGWQDVVLTWLEKLVQERQDLAICLWGRKAEQFFAPLIPQLKGNPLVLVAQHPSPFSAHRGFFGSAPFSRINQFLIEKGEEPIDWRLS